MQRQRLTKPGWLVTPNLNPTYNDQNTAKTGTHVDNVMIKAVKPIAEHLFHQSPRGIHLQQSGARFENCTFSRFCVSLKRAEMKKISCVNSHETW